MKPRNTVSRAQQAKNETTKHSPMVLKPFKAAHEILNTDIWFFFIYRYLPSTTSADIRNVKFTIIYKTQILTDISINVNGVSPGKPFHETVKNSPK